MDEDDRLRLSTRVKRSYSRVDVRAALEDFVVNRYLSDRNNGSFTFGEQKRKADIILPRKPYYREVEYAEKSNILPEYASSKNFGNNIDHETCQLSRNSNKRILNVPSFWNSVDSDERSFSERFSLVSNNKSADLNRTARNYKISDPSYLNEPLTRHDPREDLTKLAVDSEKSYFTSCASLSTKPKKDFNESCKRYLLNRGLLKGKIKKKESSSSSKAPSLRESCKCNEETVKEYMWSCGFTIRRRRNPNRKNKCSKRCYSYVEPQNQETRTIKQERRSRSFDSQYCPYRRRQNFLSFEGIRDFKQERQGERSEDGKTRLSFTRPRIDLTATSGGLNNFANELPRLNVYQLRNNPEVDRTNHNTKNRSQLSLRKITVYHFDANFNAVESENSLRVIRTKEEEDMKTNSGKKPIRIHLINDESLLLVFEAKATVQELFDQVCTLLSIKDTQFFGLTTIIENEQRFMDLKQRLYKYASKEWGTADIKKKTSDSSLLPSAYLIVQFQVQYYVEHPRLICDKPSRTQYYLQMKKNVLLTKVTTQDETLFTLAGYSLQSDFGPFNIKLHAGKYFDPKNYFPSWYLDRWGEDYIHTNLPHLHSEIGAMSVFEAQAEFIKRSSIIDDVPIHYYKLFKTKKEICPSVVLGIFHRGIRIHHGAPDKSKGKWKLEFEFMWNKGRKFEIYPEDVPESRKLIYYTGSHSRSKYLLRLLSDTHSLYMSLSPYAQHMRRVDGKKGIEPYRETYVSGELLKTETTVQNEQTSPQAEVSSPDVTHKNKSFMSHYTSTTSHGSSRTSGIESDSKQLTEKEDDEEDEREEDSTSDLGYVNVTERELSSMPSKSISVLNLIDNRDEINTKPREQSINNDSSITYEKNIENSIENNCFAASVTSVVLKSDSSTPTSGTPVAFIEDEIVLGVNKTTQRENEKNLITHEKDLIQKLSNENVNKNNSNLESSPIKRNASLHKDICNVTSAVTSQNSSLRSTGMQSTMTNLSEPSRPKNNIQAKCRSNSTTEKSSSKILWLTPRTKPQTFYNDIHTVPRQSKQTTVTTDNASSPHKHSRTDRSRRPRANTATSPNKPTRYTKASTFYPLYRSLSTDVGFQSTVMSNLTNNITGTQVSASGVHTINKTTLSHKSANNTWRQRQKENNRARPHSYYDRMSSYAVEDFKPLISSIAQKSVDDLRLVEANQTLIKSNGSLVDSKHRVSKDKGRNQPQKRHSSRAQNENERTSNRSKSGSKSARDTTHSHVNGHDVKEKRVTTRVASDRKGTPHRPVYNPNIAYPEIPHIDGVLV